MASKQLNDPVNLNDLIRAYIRFKDWMDYEAERSAYSAKEIVVMQALFGTGYIIVPPELIDASYEELLDAMESRQTLLVALSEALYDPTSEGKFDDLQLEVDKSTFRSTVHYFTTLYEAIYHAADNVSFEDESDPENHTIDNEPFDDHFDEVDEAMFEEVRNFIISEHPKIELMAFPVEKAYALGLPRQVPDPIDHGPTGDLSKLN